MSVKTAGVGHFQIPTAPAAGVSVTSGAANAYTTTAVQLIASTAAALFITGIFVEEAAVSAGTYISVQLMIGTAGSETVIGQYLVGPSTGSTVTRTYRPISPPIPVANATRIAAKTADSVGAIARLVSLECIAQSNVVDDGVAQSANVIQWSSGAVPAPNVTGVPIIDEKYLLGTVIAAPATAGIRDVNVKNMNNVAATAITTINANMGSTQPVNFTGAGASALLKSDTVDWAGGAIPAPNVTGVPLIDLKYILGTVLTETAGQIAGAFKKFFNVASPTLTCVGLDQTGDSFARIGATGSGLTSLAPASSALSTANWTNARAGYLDNLNVGGNVATHADIVAINTSSSKHIILSTVGQYERPESGNTVYTIEARTFSALDGSAVNADSTPTLTGTGQTSGSLAANISAASNPATGVYRWTYTVASSATLEPVRFDVSATISSAVFTLSAYTQILDEVAVTWSSTDASHLTSIFNKLPSNNIADETLVLAAIGTPMQAGNVTLAAAQPNYAPAKAGDAMTLTAAYDAAKTALPATSYTAPDNADILLIKAKTDNLPASPAATSDIPTAVQNADALLKRDWTLVSGEASRSALNALRFIRNKFSTVAHANQVTVYKEDDVTEAFTKNITVDATAKPITEG
jgi:hypothetical protein